MKKRQKLLVLSARALRVAKALEVPPVPGVGSSDAWTQHTWRSEGQIMEAAGLCRSTVRRALKDLTPYVLCRALQTGGRGRPQLVYALRHPHSLAAAPAEASRD